MRSTPVDFSARPGQDVAAVTLIRPPVVVFPHSLSGHGPVPPVGLAYVAAVLRQIGHRVDVVDGPGEALDAGEDFDVPVGTLRRIGLTPTEIVDRIDPATEVIGITQMFLHEWPQAREVAELARRRCPSAVIVAGGDNATVFWSTIFEETDAIDHVVLGEGEATMAELVSRVAAGRPVGAMPGLASRRPVEGADDPGLPLRIRSLDAVPRPAWDLFPLENYFHHADYLGVERGRSMPVLATRGCPYQCSFCSSPQMWTTRYVVREPADVAAEIADHVVERGVQNIDFTDLTAITKRQWTLDFCDALDTHGLDITWQLPVGTRAEALDAEVLRRLWETGCRNITYAPENGSKRMLEIFDKRVDLDHILTSIRAAHRLGLRVHVNTIIGHPAERWADRWHTLRFLMKAALAGSDTGSAIMFAPYPGSKDFDALVESGSLVVDEAFIYVGLSRGASSSRSYHPTLSSRRLRLVQLVMMACFYGMSIVRKPSRLWAMVKAQRTGDETTHMDQFIRIKRRGFVGTAGDTPQEDPSRSSAPAPLATADLEALGQVPELLDR